MTTPCATSSSAIQFFFVRHGRTARNAKGEEIQGWVNDQDAQLDELGKQQAEEVGQNLLKLYGDGFKAIYSSPLDRCIETANLINHHLKLPQIQKHSGFKEICHGQHDTMSFKIRNQECEKSYTQKIQKFKAQHPEEKPDRFFKWNYNPLKDRPIPQERVLEPFEGKLETIYEVYERATKALKEIAEEMGKKYPGESVQILVITHAGVARTLADEAEYRERDDLDSILPAYYEKNSSQTRFLPGNCSVFQFSVNPLTKEISFKGTLDFIKELQHKV